MVEVIFWACQSSRCRPILTQTFIYKIYNLVYSIGLKPLLARYPLNQAVDTFDMFCSTE
tara:strand:- start:25 stop:201 length:177 start_codon:yes stop_codon:yes gene_type:complete